MTYVLVHTSTGNLESEFKCYATCYFGDLLVLVLRPSERDSELNWIGGGRGMETHMFAGRSLALGAKIIQSKANTQLISIESIIELRI
jgi:hypothetical protein